MTQIGIDYLKNEETKRANRASEAINRERNAETARANLAAEAQKWASLQQQERASVRDAQMRKYAADRSANASKYAADSSRGASKYAADSSRNASKYAADASRKKGTLVDTLKAGFEDFGVAGGVGNVLGWLWDTLI